MEPNQRECPECKIIMTYSTPVSCRSAEKKKRYCKSCSKKGSRNPQHGNVGEKNPFYNKTHSIKSIELMRISHTGKKHTEEFKENHKKIFTGSKKNIECNSHIKVWIKKYGEEKANLMLDEYKKKISNKYSGKGNPMYGKPSPNGSGNGWSGWYKGWFFRSIHELSFMINVIERFNFKWVTGEKKEHIIQYYDFNNKLKNYFPDFILNEKYVVEIKPKRLFNSFVVKSKSKAAKEYCHKHGLKFKLICPNIIKTEIIKSKIENGEIVFMEKYDFKVKEWIKNN